LHAIATELEHHHHLPAADGSDDAFSGEEEACCKLKTRESSCNIPDLVKAAGINGKKWLERMQGVREKLFNS